MIGMLKSKTDQSVGLSDATQCLISVSTGRWG